MMMKMSLFIFTSHADEKCEVNEEWTFTLGARISLNPY